MERYDFELVKKMQACDTLLNKQIVQKGDTFIYIGTMTENGSFYKEYLPSPAFFIILKTFYPDGMLRVKGKRMGRHLRIGVWQFYDKRGNLIKEVDEDAKFGVIKPEHILKFLDKKGHINLETGEGRPHIVFSDKGQPYYADDYKLTIVFVPQKGAEETPNSIDFISEDRKREYPYFSVTVSGDPSNGYQRTYYMIHGETGKILEKTVDTDPGYYI